MCEGKGYQVFEHDPANLPEITPEYLDMLATGGNLILRSCPCEMSTLDGNRYEPDIAATQPMEPAYKGLT